MNKQSERNNSHSSGNGEIYPTARVRKFLKDRF